MRHRSGGFEASGLSVLCKVANTTQAMLACYVGVAENLVVSYPSIKK